MDSWGGWDWVQMSSVTLANGTNKMVGLTSSMNIADQGWGGEWAPGNQVVIGLFSNGSDLFNVHVAGGYHNWTFQTFDIAYDTAALDGFNNTLKAIDWSASPTVTLQMFAAPIGYPGWTLHATEATFTADTANVPEPASLALLGFGLAGLAVARRRKV